MNELDVFVAWAERELTMLDDAILNGLATDESYKTALARRLIWVQVIDKAKHVAEGNEADFS